MATSGDFDVAIDNRLEDALRDGRQEDLWRSRRSSPRVGDRVAVWKFLGKKGNREQRWDGVVALGEVVAEARVCTDAGNPYWVNAANALEPDRRVAVRYVRRLEHPLSADVYPEAAVLTIRGGQGTVFRVTAEQWEDLVRAAGGWPGEG